MLQKYKNLVLVSGWGFIRRENHISFNTCKRHACSIYDNLIPQHEKKIPNKENKVYKLTSNDIPEVKGSTSLLEMSSQ